ncbi:hypothetical protein BT93_G2096 [Corymbia citriodora subsp. variegata]|nr:hypothetical protein BT93_G2096 [Corymbia citriodora subsp. variegata]
MDRWCKISPWFWATLAPPVKGKMFKGLCVCCSVIVTVYFRVGISGYRAFGNQSKGTILTNFMGDIKPLLPALVPLDDQHLLPPPVISRYCGVLATDQQSV